MLTVPVGAVFFLKLFLGIFTGLGPVVYCKRRALPLASGVRIYSEKFFKYFHFIFVWRKIVPKNKWSGLIEGDMGYLELLIN